MPVRIYAQVLGVVLLLLGILGLLLGERALLGIVNIDIVEDIVHLITGGILAYVGFGQRDEGVARSVVGALGVVYLLVGVLGFVLPSLFGLLPHGYSVADNLIHLALGILSLVVAFAFGSSSRTARAQSKRSTDSSSCRRGFVCPGPLFEKLCLSMAKACFVAVVVFGVSGGGFVTQGLLGLLGGGFVCEKRRARQS